MPTSALTDDKWKLRVPQGAVYKYDDKVGRKIFCFAEKILATRTAANMRQEFLVAFFGSTGTGDSWHDTSELLSCQSVRAHSACARNVKTLYAILRLPCVSSHALLLCTVDGRVQCSP